MDSLVAQSTGKLVAVILICLAAAVWMLAVVTNFRGYRERTFRRALQVGQQARRRGLPTTSWSSEERRIAVLKAAQLVVVWIILLGVTTFAAFAIAALVVKLWR
jgi:hypothetical protein